MYYLNTETLTILPRHRLHWLCRLPSCRQIIRHRHRIRLCVVRRQASPLR